MSDVNGSDGNRSEINKLHSVVYTDAVSCCIWMPFCPIFCSVGDLILQGWHSIIRDYPNVHVIND